MYSKKTMATIRLDVLKKKDAELVDFAREVIIRVTGDAYFQFVQADVSELNQALHDFERDITTTNSSRAGQATTRLRRKVLELHLTRLAMHIEQITQGDPNKILASGMPLRGKAENK